VTNPENGAEVGMRTVRDTIFIKPTGDKLEVSNRKWAKNDYDLEGWKNMEHAEDRPFPTSTANFEPVTNSFHLDNGNSPSLSMNPNKSELKNGKLNYNKVEL